MHTPSRRGFLAGSLAAFAAAGYGLGADSPKGGKPSSASTTKASGMTKPVDPTPAKPPATPAIEPKTLFLTWQRDPTTTMTVQWIGTLADTPDARVYYAPAPRSSSSAESDATTRPTTGPATQPTPRPAARTPPVIWLTQTALARPYPMSADLKVFRAELTGLTPGTTYQFHVGKNPTYRFQTMPAKATDTIHFISGGDCGVNPHAEANNVQAARQDPMFAVIGGDLAYENGKTLQTAVDFVRNYSRHMVGRDGRLIPLLACLGNHEVDGGYDKPRSKAPFFYALFDGLFRETSYATLDFGDYLSLVLLDTGHNSPIGGEQASWLDKTLAARADHPNVLCVNHVPAYPSYRKMDPEAAKAGEHPKGGTGAANRQFWTPLFDKHRVPVVLEHHDHTFKRTKPLLDGMAHPDGVLYLGDGSWGKLRSPQSPEKMSILAAASRDYHLTLHRIQGEERFHLALDEFGRVMDVSHSGQRRRGLVAVPG